MTHYFSIDFGNQYCVVYEASNHRQGAYVVSLQGQTLFPTKATFFIDDRNRWLELGCDLAEAREFNNSEGTVRDIKKLIENAKQDGKMNFELTVKSKGEERRITIQYVISVILTRLISVIRENYPKLEGELNIAICVSPYWGDTERRMMLDAAEISGLKKVRLVNSTTAQAMLYYIRFMRKESDLNRFKMAMIDMGDSTLDIAVASVTKEDSSTKIEIDNFNSYNIGGWDFTKKLLNYILEELKKFLSTEKGKQNDGEKIHIETNFTLEEIENLEKEWHTNTRLYLAAEKAKKNMKLSNEVVFTCLNVIPAKDIRMPLLLSGFIESCKDELAKVAENLNDSLGQYLNKNGPDKLSVIEANGGAFRFGPVLEIFMKFIEGKNVDMSNSLNPEECFAEGAVYWLMANEKILKTKIQIIDCVTYQVCIHDNQNKTIEFFDINKDKVGVKKDKIYELSDETKVVEVIEKKHPKEIIIGKIKRDNIHNDLKISFHMSECGLFEIDFIELVHGERHSKVSFNRLNIISKDKISDLICQSEKIQEIEKYEKSKENAEYKFLSQIGEMKSQLSENGSLKSYINKETASEFIQKLDKYELNYCEFFNPEMILHEIKELETDFQKILAVKSTYDEADKRITKYREDAKIMINKIPGSNQDINGLLKEFIGIARKARQDLNAISDKTNRISDDHKILSELDCYFTKFQKDLEKFKNQNE